MLTGFMRSARQESRIAPDASRRPRAETRCVRPLPAPGGPRKYMRASAPLPRTKQLTVGIHAQAHRAAGFAPFEARLQEYLVQPSSSACFFTRCEPGTTRARTFGRLVSPATPAAASKVFDARIRAGTNEDHVNRDVAYGCTRFESHVPRRARRSLLADQGRS